MVVLEGMFFGEWCQIAVGRMETVAIIPSLNIGKNGGTCFAVGIKNVVRAFGFKGAKKTLHAGIIPTVGFATHTDLHLSGGQGALKTEGGILTALVRMKQEIGSSRRWLPSLKPVRPNRFAYGCPSPSLRTCAHTNLRPPPDKASLAG